MLPASRWRVYGVAAAVADSHHQLHGVSPDLPGVHIGLRRHDVIERRQAEPAAGQQEYAEILGVPAVAPNSQNTIWAFRNRFWSASGSSRSRPSSWWRFQTEAEALRVQRRW